MEKTAERNNEISRRRLEGDYFVGIDVGTDSVGYAVTYDDYSLCKFKGEAMWGAALFEEAKTSPSLVVNAIFF